MINGGFDSLPACTNRVLIPPASTHPCRKGVASSSVQMLRWAFRIDRSLPLNYSMVYASPDSACEYRHAGRAPACRAIHEHDFVARQPIVGEASEEAGNGDAQLKPRQR